MLFDSEESNMVGYIYYDCFEFVYAISFKADAK